MQAYTQRKTNSDSVDGLLFLQKLAKRLGDYANWSFVDFLSHTHRQYVMFMSTVTAVWGGDGDRGHGDGMGMGMVFTKIVGWGSISVPVQTSNADRQTTRALSSRLFQGGV